MARERRSPLDPLPQTSHHLQLSRPTFTVARLLARDSGQGSLMAEGRRASSLLDFGGVLTKESNQDFDD